MVLFIDPWLGSHATPQRAEKQVEHEVKIEMFSFQRISISTFSVHRQEKEPQGPKRTRSEARPGHRQAEWSGVRAAWGGRSACWQGQSMSCACASLGCLVLATHMFQSKRTHSRRIQKLYMAWLQLHVASVAIPVVFLAVVVGRSEKRISILETCFSCFFRSEQREKRYSDTLAATDTFSDRDTFAGTTSAASRLLLRFRTLRGRKHPRTLTDV